MKINERADKLASDLHDFQREIQGKLNDMLSLTQRANTLNMIHPGTISNGALFDLSMCCTILAKDVQRLTDRIYNATGDLYDFVGDSLDEEASTIDQRDTGETGATQSQADPNKKATGAA